MVRVKGTLSNTILQVKVEEGITRKASKTVVGRCKGMNHEEDQQDSGWTM